MNPRVWGRGDYGRPGHCDVQSWHPGINSRGLRSNWIGCIRSRMREVVRSGGVDNSPMGTYGSLIWDFTTTIDVSARHNLT